MRSLGDQVTSLRLHEYAQALIEAAAARGSTNLGAIRKYAVISTPRTGSNLFCAVLRQNGFGWPAEWFNPLYIQHAREVLGQPELDLREYVQLAVRGSYTSETGIFGVNIHTHQYAWLKAHGVDLLDLGFAGIYYLERRSKVKQAYSRAKSLKSGFWDRNSEIDAGYAEPVPVNIDSAEFCESLAFIVREAAIPDDRLRAAITRTFFFEDIVGGGMAPAVSAVSADLARDAGALDVSLPHEPQSTAHDRNQLDAILRSLGMANP